MSSRLESRLRDILRERRQREGDAAREGGPDPSPVQRAPVDAGALGRRLAAAADVLDGEVFKTPAGAFLIVERFYPVDHWHGLARIGDLAGESLSSCAELALIGGRPEPADGPPRALLFVDLETTGLAGGAGTYAFLVGCAFFEPHGFRTRQYFLPGYQHEPPLLEAVEGLVRRSAGLVSFNGKSFDVPVLETRYQFNRLAPPFDGMAHVDMLHVARRFWRSAPEANGLWPDTDSCRLGALERVLFGVRRVGDVPGFEIPGRYFDYMRSGDATPLLPVLEHNRLDLLSLAVLTARALATLGDAPASCRSARESLAAGRYMERAGRVELAVRCYEDAADRARRERGPDASPVRAEALRAVATRYRRDGRYDEAASAWQALADERSASPALKREALEALAIHFEHRARDLDLARRFAQRSLAERVGTMSMDAGRHRLARLDRKLGTRMAGPGEPDPPPLLQG